MPSTNVSQEGIMTRTKLTLIAASVAAAVGLFAVKMLIAPPISLAAITANIPVEQLTLNAPKTFPTSKTGTRDISAFSTP